MLNVLEAVILGIIQGLAEFLPISSSGHLVLAQSLLKMEEPAMAFDVMLHLGTLVPVLIIYRKDVWKLIKNPFQKLTVMLIFGTLPAVVAALLFGDWFESLFNGGTLLWPGFFITGVLLLLADRMQGGRKQVKNMAPIDALIIGCVQAVAIIPGISRSGSTVTASLTRKLDRKAAAKYSFLLSIPAILGAAVLQVKDMLGGEDILGDITLLPVVMGTLAAMLTGYLAITFMIKLIEKSNLKVFSYYVFALGAILLAVQFILK